MDNELVSEVNMVKNHSEATKIVYERAVKKYTDFWSMSLEELLEEAENEEDKGIKWKKRKLKRRLIQYRQHLLENFSLNTAHIYFNPITVIYRYYEIEIIDLPKINEKSLKKPEPIQFKDLPDKEIIRQAINIATPTMKAIIYFMASSGCARTETLNLTIGDYIGALSEYTNKTNIYDIINELNENNNIIPTFSILRQKTGKYYTTYCSPEAVKAINLYLLDRTDYLTDYKPLFRINSIYFNAKFIEINNKLGLGKVGSYNRFRSHMLRKFHASALYNDGMSLDKVNDLQGKAKNKTDQAYFMTNPEDLKHEYIKHLPAVTINQDVEKLSIKSPEFIQMENENKELKSDLDELKSKIKNIENFVKNSGDVL